MAVKFEFIDNTNRALLYFTEMQKLGFYEDTRLNYVKYGKNNLYPNELVRLYDEHPEHRAIVNGKASYLWGKGLKAKDPVNQPKVDAYMKTFNRKEGLEKTGPKTAVWLELMNAVYFQVITNMFGKPVEFYMLNSAKVRLSECGTLLSWSKNWAKNRCEIITLNEYKPGCKAGSYFVKFVYESPSVDNLSEVYPKAQYQSCVKEIHTDIDISTFNQNYVANGFSAATIVTFFTGDPPAEVKADIKKRLTDTHAGPDNAGKTVINYVDRDGKSAEITSLSVDDLDKKFEVTSGRCQQKIITGHDIKNGELFGIVPKTGGITFNRTSLLESQELFVNGYVTPRQTPLVAFHEQLNYWKTGEYIEMEIDPITMIGADLSNDQDLTQDERRKLKGYEPLTTPALGPDGNPLPVKAKQVDDNLKGLSAKENADMVRIVRDFQAKRNGMNEHVAITRLKAYGLDESEAKKWLGIDMQMSSTDRVLMALEAAAIDENTDDEIVKMEFAHIHNSAMAQRYQNQLMQFKDALVITASELDSAVLNALKGNPLMTVDQLANQLNYDAFFIDESIARLTSNKLLIKDTAGFKPTEKGFDKDTEPVDTVEIYTRYKYMLKNDAPKLQAGGSSRPFCLKMMQMSLAGKEWEFETIDNMSNDLGTNVWDYKGGYYNNPKTKETEPDCRHAWFAVTRKRKIKK